MNVEKVELELRREPFVRPFGFKGSAFHEKWTPVVKLVDGDGRQAFGVGGLTPLWSDSRVFRAHTETGGNALQLAVLEHALGLVEGRSFPDPMAMHDAVVEGAHDYARRITGFGDLCLTFTLVALGALDYAAWLLHARTAGISDFEAIVPEEFRGCLSERRERVALVPAVGYTMPGEQLAGLLDAGACVLKIKIGQAGPESEMLARDKARLDGIHELASGREAEMTDSGKVLYYLDANGRYPGKGAVSDLLAHCDSRGYLDRVVLIEEPYSQPDEHDVHGLPARFAGDESVQSAGDLRRRLEQGYGAFAIKTAGKTVSRCFRLLKAATEGGAVPFVADNACVPVMVEWNKMFAAHLPAFPGVAGGIMESNGPQNYAHWDRLLAELPCAGARWLRPQRGSFVLTEDYYAASGGVFEAPASYSGLFR